MVTILEIQLIVDKSWRIRLSLAQRGEKLASKVLLSERDGGVLVEPYDEHKAKQREYIESRFGTNDRLTLPVRMSRSVGIGKAVTVTINDNNTIFIFPALARCMLCGSADQLHAVGNKSDTFICDNCLRQKK